MAFIKMFKPRIVEEDCSRESYKLKWDEMNLVASRRAAILVEASDFDGNTPKFFKDERSTGHFKACQGIS